MKVELNIADDSELRNTIKDLIKGEVKSVMRSELKGILKDLTQEQVIPKDSETLEKLLREEMRHVVKEELKLNGNWSSNTIRTMARDEIYKILQEVFNRDQFNIKEGI